MTTSNRSRTERRLVDSIRQAKGAAEPSTESPATPASHPEKPSAKPAPASARSVPAQRPGRARSAGAETAVPPASRRGPEESDPGGIGSAGTFQSGGRVWPD